MADCTWEKVDGRYICTAKQCTHWSIDGCKLSKVSLTCDNNDCKWNTTLAPGVYGCNGMDVHLDAEGKCLCIKKEEDKTK